MLLVQGWNDFFSNVNVILRLFIDENYYFVKYKVIDFLIVDQLFYICIEYKESSLVWVNWYLCRVKVMVFKMVGNQNQF